MVIKNPNEYQRGKTIVYFVRHGEIMHIPGAPRPHDFGLSKEGKKQAKTVAKMFIPIKSEVDIIYSSPMKRAYETAIEIGKAVGKKPKVIKGFEEVHKILEHPNPFSKNYWSARIDFSKKQKIFDDLLEKNKCKVIVIVAHGRLNRMLVGRKLGLSDKKSNLFDSNNCHISRIRFKGKKIDYLNYINSRNLIIN